MGGATMDGATMDGATISGGTLISIGNDGAWALFLLDALGVREAMVSRVPTLDGAADCVLVSGRLTCSVRVEGGSGNDSMGLGTGFAFTGALGCAAAGVAGVASCAVESATISSIS